MFFQIFFAQKAAVLAHELVDLVPDLAVVESVASFFADESERFRQRRIFENVALRRRASVDRVGLGEAAGQTFVKLRSEMPVKRDQLGNRKTFLGVTDRRREIIGEFQFPKFFVQLRPGIHRSRHADWQHSARRNHFAIQFVQLGLHLFVAQTERRTSAAVDSVKLVFFRAVNDSEQIAADSVRNRLH